MHRPRDGSKLTITKKTAEHRTDTFGINQLRVYKHLDGAELSTFFLIQVTLPLTG
jgi:hypothetical protein